MEDKTILDLYVRRNERAIAETAAYTILEAANGGLPEPREKAELTLDRPFLFVVTNEAGLPLFVGVVNNP